MQDKKKVIFTIDTEGHKGLDPVKHLILGETAGGELCGIDLIMDICDEFSIKALFFVDFAEAWHFGKEKIEYVAKHIKERGHDVGVHIHPDHMADSKKLFLAEYSYEEQYDIIKRCTDLYTEILNESPVSFRAGKYGANNETLEILKKLGYIVDFSEFVGQKWCYINPPIAYNNIVELENGLLEVPVTAYKSFELFNYSRTDKWDIGQPFYEIMHVAKKIKKVGSVQPAVFFAHSFSFIKWRSHPNSPVKDNKEIKKLKKVFKILSSDSQYEFISLEDLVKEKSKLIKNTQDRKELFQIKGILSFVFFLLRAIKVLKMRIEILINRYSK